MNSCENETEKMGRAIDNYLETGEMLDDSSQEHIAKCKSCREYFFNSAMVLKTAKTLPLEEAPGHLYAQIMHSVESVERANLPSNLLLLAISFLGFILVNNFELELWNTLSWTLALLALLLLKPLFANQQATASS
jgi:hypothetical protein